MKHRLTRKLDPKRTLTAEKSEMFHKLIDGDIVDIYNASDEITMSYGVVNVGKPPQLSHSLEDKVIRISKIRRGLLILGAITALYILMDYFN